MTPPTYVIVRREDDALWMVETTDELVTFMWGRDFKDYAIYKLFPWSDGDLAKFREAVQP